MHLDILWQFIIRSFRNIESDFLNYALPLGHSAIGFTTYCLISKSTSSFNQWKLAVFIIILSNLPDMDVLFGLILQNNGSAIHRGPTHSILFAFIMGFAAPKIDN
jgi:membrane-bound metal-dependent hydrolase YbcI (DUF457 family)